MKRSRKSDKSILLLAPIILVALVIIVYSIVQFRADNFTNLLKDKKLIAILFLISDEDRLEFMDILLYHPGTKKGGLFYIPANIGSKIESLDRIDRIDVLYTQSDFQTIKKKVEQLTDLYIPFYINISLINLVHLVDLVGGLELFISNPVNLDMNGKKVLLPSGSILLDGDKIRDFLTYEEKMEEEGEKIRRKQKFFQALFKKIGDPATENFLMMGDSFQLLKEYLKTNLGSRALQSYITEHSKLNLLSGIHRVLGSQRSVDDVEGEVLFPYNEGNLIKVTIKQIVEAITRDDSEYDESLTITLEILNGTNIDGLAKRTKALFENYGFDVVSYRNADNDKYLDTVVLDRKGNISMAEKIAEVIKCDKIHTRIEPDINVDVTLILGKNFDGTYCK